MPIDIEAAMAAELPVLESEWDVKDVLLYHVAVGAGARPTDERELTYAYEQSLQVLPTFGVLPAVPLGLALTEAPGFDIAITQALHGEHRIEVGAPLPATAKVRTTGRVAEVFDKGSGALVVLDIETADFDGNVLARNLFSMFVRGEGGFGRAQPPVTPFEQPSRAPDRVVLAPTLPQQALLYRLTGDSNPIHADPAMAKAAGFDQPILHGLCSFGIIARTAITAVLDGDASAVTAMGARFAGVVFPGEHLAVSLWDEPGRIVVQASTVERGSPVLTNAVIEHR